MINLDGEGVVCEQTRLQTEQSGHIAEQTRLLTQQVRTVALTNKSILYQNVTKEMQQINGIFLGSPRLRQYFYDGVPVPHDLELRTQLEIVSEMFVDFMAFTLNTDALFDDDERGSWVRYFKHIASSSPAI